MKRLTGILLILLWSMMMLRPTTAQPATPPTQGNDEAILKQAAQVASDALEQGKNAVSVVSNADNAVNTTNNLLGIVVGALAIGGILLVLIGILGFRALFSTLREMRGDLERTRGELDEMLTGVRNNATDVRQQADRAVQSLAYMQLGEQQLDRGNHQGALQLYEQAYQLDPNNQATSYFLGELYVENNQIDKGIEYLQKALTSAYAPAEAAIGRALVMQASRTKNIDEQDILYAQAEKRFLKALQIDPTALDMHSKPVQSALADLYQLQGRLDKAQQHRETARKITPKNA
jgi:tetratricopeptide (TPR) repeat protein